VPKPDADLLKPGAEVALPSRGQPKPDAALAEADADLAFPSDDRLKADANLLQADADLLNPGAEVGEPAADSWNLTRICENLTRTWRSLAQICQSLMQRWRSLLRVNPSLTGSICGLNVLCACLTFPYASLMGTSRGRLQAEATLTGSAGASFPASASFRTLR
jgi:hypothetical protein